MDRGAALSGGIGRIGLLHYSAPPIIGGVESTLAFQARFLAEAGAEPVVIAGTGGPLPPEVELRLIPQLNSRHPDVLAAKSHLDRGQIDPGFGRLREALQQALRPALADLKTVLVHNALSLHKNLALTAALWDLASIGPQFLAWHHDLAWDRPDYAAELHPGEPWDLLRRPFPGATHVAVSHSVRKRAARVFSLPESEVVVIPPGVDVPSFQGWTEALRRLEGIFGLARADALFLLPSRITRRKNIEYAIRVTAEARRFLGDVRLLVTGPPGPHNPTNQTYLQELLALVNRLDLGELCPLPPPGRSGRAGRPRRRHAGRAVSSLRRLALHQPRRRLWDPGVGGGAGAHAGLLYRSPAVSRERRRKRDGLLAR